MKEINSDYIEQLIGDPREGLVEFGQLLRERFAESTPGMYTALQLALAEAIMESDGDLGDSP